MEIAESEVGGFHGGEPPARVHVARLRLTAFRNYASLSLAFDGRPVVLTGENGAGKTNLLEAVSFLSPGRGLRRALLAEVARQPGDGTWAVSATLAGPRGEVEIGTGLVRTPDGAETLRRVRINRAPASGTDALLEHVRVVWLTPAMDGLFAGPASDRRRFLDRLVLAIDRRHGRRVAALERALSGRNRLLAEPRPDVRWLDAVETEIAELATAIAAARRECVGLLGAEIAGTRPEGADAFPTAGIAIAGGLEQALATAPATDVEDGYRRALAVARPADAAAGRTLSGPHLSDLVVRHAAKDREAAGASTGEQKALLAGLVLAHARLIARLTGETPVLLLDEIAAHFDPRRRAALYRLILDLGAQAFLTGTDRAAFEALGEGAQRFTVADGRVEAA